MLVGPGDNLLRDGRVSVKLNAASHLVMILAVTASVAHGQELPPALHALPSEHTLVGRLLLPSGSGSRGVEVIVETAAGGGEPRKVWLLFDEQGNFSPRTGSTWV